MQDKLKPCPMCGDKTEYKPFINRKCEFDGEIRKRESFNAECDNCGLATLPSLNGYKGAVEMWNHRVSNETVLTFVAALEEARKYIKDMNGYATVLNRIEAALASVEGV